MELGKYETALQAFEQVLCQKPESREAWYRKGLALIKLERFEDAIKAFDEVIIKDANFKDIKSSNYNDTKNSNYNDTENPDYDDARTYKGFAQMQLERYIPALETFESALKERPDSDILWYYKGLSLYRIQHARRSSLCL